MISCEKLIFFPNNSSLDRKHACLVENDLHHAFRGRKTLFWPINALILAKKSIIEQFWALDPQNSALCAKNFLVHGILGYKRHRKDSGFKAVLALLTKFFTKITHKCHQITTGNVVTGYLVC